MIPEFFFALTSYANNLLEFYRNVLAREDYESESIPKLLIRMGRLIGAGLLGSVTVKTLPWPFTLSTEIVPLIKRTSRAVIASPNPNPSCVRDAPSDS